MNAKLLAKIKDECSEVDVDKLYDDMIEELYGEELRAISIFSHLDAGKLHRETDEVGARCGTNDYVDGLQKDGEIDSPDGGNTYYRVEDMEAVRDEYASELENEIDHLKENDADEDEIKAFQDELDEIKDCALND